MDRLPIEIVLLICETLYLPLIEPYRFELQLRCLCWLLPLCHTSRWFNSIVQPLIYQIANDIDTSRFRVMRIDRAEAPFNPFPFGGVHIMPGRRVSLPPSFNDWDRDSVLLHAAKSGNLRLLQNLAKRFRHQYLTVGQYLNEPFYDFNVNQHCDISDNQNRCCDLHGKSTACLTPLHAAVSGGHIEVVQWLLEQGVEVDSWSESVCLCHSRLHKIRRNGADLDATPLLIALCYGYDDIAMLLVRHDARWYRYQSYRWRVTTLHVIAVYGLVDFASFLAEHDRTSRYRHRSDWPDDGGRYALHYVCYAPNTITACEDASSTLVHALEQFTPVVMHARHGFTPFTIDGEDDERTQNELTLIQGKSYQDEFWRISLRAYHSPTPGLKRYAKQHTNRAMASVLKKYIGEHPAAFEVD